MIWWIQHLLLPAGIYVYDPFFGLFLMSLYTTVAFSHLISSALHASLLLWVVALFGRVYQLGNPEKVERIKTYLFVTLPEQKPFVRQARAKIALLSARVHDLHLCDNLSSRFNDSTGLALNFVLEKTNFEDTAKRIAHYLWPGKARPVEPDLHIIGE